MLRINRLTAATAIAAVFCMTAASAGAVELPHSVGPAAAQAYDGDANSAERNRWRRRHRDGIDGGDILTGVLILGGIAAVASAVENSNRDRDYRDYPPPPPQGGYNDGYEYRGGVPQAGSSGLDRAADICRDAIERTIDPVGSIESVRRGPTGWDVDGTLRNGRPFACTIGNDGQITDIRTDGDYSGAAYQESGNPDGAYGDDGYDDRPYYDDQSAADGQYDDETYARLRAQRDGQGG